MTLVTVDALRALDLRGLPKPCAAWACRPQENYPSEEVEAAGLSGTASGDPHDENQGGAMKRTIGA